MRNTFVKVAAALILLSAVLICGCTTQSGASPAEQTQGVTEDGSFTLTDDSGTVITITPGFKRVISLAPSITELYFAIAGNSDKSELVGRTIYDNYPKEALSVPAVGGITAGTSIEAVISKNPDIIIGMTMTDMTMVEQLRKAGYTVVLYDIDSVQDIYDKITLTGRILYEEENAEKLIAELKEKLDEIGKKTEGMPKKTVMYAVSYDPVYIAGGATYLDELVSLAGGENIYSDREGYFSASAESIIERQPEIIITIDGTMDQGTNMTDMFMHNKELSEIPAVKNGHVYSVDDDIVSRPGPRLGEALEIIYGCISSS